MSIQAQHLAVLSRKRAGGYGAAAQARIDAIEAAGGTPTTAEKDAIDVFFSTVDITALWKRFFVPVWGAAAPNAIDWVDPTRSGTWNGGVTHSAGYSVSNGTTGYLNFGVTPSSASLTNDDASFVLYTGTGSSSIKKNLLGCRNSTSQQFDMWQSLNGTDFLCMNATTGLITVHQVNDVGFFMGNRKSGTREILSKIASELRVEVTATDSAVGSVPTVNCYAMARNDNGTANSFNDWRWSVLGMGLGHTSGQRTTFLNAAYTMLNSFTTHKPNMV